MPLKEKVTLTRAKILIYDIRVRKESAKSFFDDGYYVIKEEDGYYLLTKPSDVLVDVENEKGEIYNPKGFKKFICSLYQERILSKELLDKFISDTQRGDITLAMDSQGFLTVVNSR